MAEFEEEKMDKIIQKLENLKVFELKIEKVRLNRIIRVIEVILRKREFEEDIQRTKESLIQKSKIEQGE